MIKSDFFITLEKTIFFKFLHKKVFGKYPVDFDF